MVHEAIDNLKNHKVIAIPTDTIYGIATLAQSKEAVEKLYEIKSRDYCKPISICVGDVDDVYRLVLYKYLLTCFYKTNHLYMYFIVGEGSGLLQTNCFENGLHQNATWCSIALLLLTWLTMLTETFVVVQT